MLEVFKKEKCEKYLKVPSIKNQSDSQINQNKWIQELHQKLKVNLENGIKPLEEYLNKFN